MLWHKGWLETDTGCCSPSASWFFFNFCCIGRVPRRKVSWDSFYSRTQYSWS